MLVSGALLNTCKQPQILKYEYMTAMYWEPTMDLNKNPEISQN